VLGEHQPADECGDSNEHSRERTSGADIEKGDARRYAGAQPDEGSEGADERGRGQNPGQRRVDAVKAAGNVVAGLVRGENAEESESEGPSGGETLGVMNDPREREEAGVHGEGGRAALEVVHEHGAGAESGEYAEAEKAERDAGLLELRGLADRDGLQRCGLAERSGDLDGRLTHARLSWLDDLERGDPRREQCIEAGALRQYFIDCRFISVEEVEFLARLEANRFARGNADFGSGAGITADSGLAGPNVEDPEAAELDALTFGESALKGLEYGVDRSLGFIALQPGALDHLVNDVLFYQDFPPSGEVSVSRLIVEMFDGIVNAACLP
jgi:hypothetical protein